MRNRSPGRGLTIAVCLIAAALAAPGRAPADGPPDFAPAIPTPAASKRLLLGLASNGERLIAVGEQGHILLSDDSGGTWRHADVPVARMLTDVSFADASHAWAVGHDAVLLESTDRGETWRKVLDGTDIAAMQADAAQREIERLEAVLDAMPEDDPAREDTEYALDDAAFDLEDAEAVAATGITSPLLGVRFVDARHGFAFGAYGVLLETRDAGASWQLVSNRLDNPDNKHLYAMATPGDGSLLLVGEAGAVHRSPDGGDTWSAVDLGYGGSLFGATVMGAGDVLAFGLRGRMFRSTDSGATWQEIAGDGRGTLTGGVTLPDGRVALVGASGTLLVGRPGEGALRPLEAPNGGSLSDVLPGSSGELVVVGFGGVARVPLGEAG